MDNKDLQAIVNRYLQLLEEVNNTTDMNAKSELLQETEVIKTTLNTYVEVQLKLGNVNEEFLTFVSNMDSLGVLYSDMDLGGITSNSQEVENSSDTPKYELSCNRIKSELTGEEISLIGLSTYEKVELIYAHTGTIIDSSDKALVTSRDASFNKFINNVRKYTSTSQLISLYGPNWVEEVERIYKEGYERAINTHINQIVEKVDVRNREKVVELEQQLLASEQEEARLQQEAEQLKKEIAVLTAQVLEIRQENKEELIRYRESLASMIDGKSTFEFTPEEKTKIVGALGIQFEPDETKTNGIGIDNDFILQVHPEMTLEQTTRQMMVCRHLGINVSATFNGVTLNNNGIDNEQQLVDTYNSEINKPKSM